MCVCGFIFKAVSVGIGYEILFTVQKYILTLYVCVFISVHVRVRKCFKVFYAIHGCIL